MGCCCVGKDDNSSKTSSIDQISENRVNIDKGQTHIEVVNAQIHENQAQFIVQAIDNNLSSGGCPILDKFKGSRQLFQNQFHSGNAKNKYEYGDIVELQLDSLNKTILFVVLSIYRGQEAEVQIFERAIQNLIDYLRQKKISSLALDDIGFTRLGYPKNIVTEKIVIQFQKAFQATSGISGLQYISFVSNDIATIKMFEDQVALQMRKNSSQQYFNLIENTKDKFRSFSFENPRKQSELQQPLLQD